MTLKSMSKTLEWVQEDSGLAGILTRAETDPEFVLGHVAQMIEDAVAEERQACAAHIRAVFCDGSAPPILTNAYEAVAKAVEQRE